jgi:hypothetical protein
MGQNQGYKYIETLVCKKKKENDVPLDIEITNKRSNVTDKKERERFKSWRENRKEQSRMWTV